VQMGSQWRSCAHILEATDLIRSGKRRQSQRRSGVGLPRLAPQHRKTGRLPAAGRRGLRYVARPGS
jgi:hypothetical protein